MYNPEKFYQVPFSGTNKLVETEELKYGDETYTIHLWSGVTHAMEFQLDSPFDKLAKRYCPIMRELYGHRFVF